jgi:hypothetical protein
LKAKIKELSVVVSHTIHMINSHDLVYAKDGGNGYHGRCLHCGVALVTDLGYCSWDNLKCVDRQIEHTSDMSEAVRSYANFRSYEWKHSIKKFTKPSFSEKLDEVSLDEMYLIVERLTTFQYH